MMHAALFVIYFFLLCFALTRLRFFNGAIRPVYLVLLFGVHVAAGCIHNWIAWHFFPRHGDIWLFFELSHELKQLLLTDPSAFVRSFFATKSQFNITDTSQPMLGVQYDVFIYLHALLNFISFNNLYINTLLFSFPVFAGTIALFRVFYIFFKNPLPAFCATLLPSALFWTSVIYKDSLFYMAIGFFCYALFQKKQSIIPKIIVLLLCVLLMVLSRANALLTMIPAVLFFFLSENKSYSRKRSAAIVLATVAITAIFFNTILPGGILTVISNRQNDFQLLEGSSRLYLPLLQPTASSFLAVFPAAFINGLFQPLPGAGGKSFYMAFSAELILIWLIVLSACRLLARNKEIRFSNFDLSCLLFALPGMVIIGYIVPFAGAIIRYRSIYLPFLLAPFVNIICSYPTGIAQIINAWLSKHVMVSAIKEQ